MRGYYLLNESCALIYAIVYKTLEVIKARVWGNFDLDNKNSLKYYVETIASHLLWMMPTTKYWQLPWKPLEWNYLDKNSMFLEYFSWRKHAANGLWDDKLNPRFEIERNEEWDWQIKDNSHNDLIIIGRSSRKSDGCTSDQIDYHINIWGLYQIK